MEKLLRAAGGVLGVGQGLAGAAGAWCWPQGTWVPWAPFLGVSFPEGALFGASAPSGQGAGLDEGLDPALQHHRWVTARHCPAGGPKPHTFPGKTFSSPPAPQTLTWDQP